MNLRTSRIAWLLATGMTLFASLAQGATAPAAVDRDTLLRGEYLAKAADCDACHRGPQPGAPAFSGGLSLPSPMGAIIGSNITPSQKYGIGAYSEAEFKRALTEGVRRDGSNLYPAMPYTAYHGLNDADVHALYLYFMHGVAPVDQAPAATTQLAFPFSARPLMWFWNQLYLSPPPPATALSSDSLKNGYYLVEVLGHCSACHTPRNLLMAEDNAQHLAGGSVGGWFAPNITADKVSGIGGWSDQELMEYLKNGHVQGKGAASGGMSEAVEFSLSKMKDDDLRDMVAYLRQVPALRGAGETQAAWQYGRSGRVDTGSEPDSGQQLYQSACAACHRLEGEGAYAGRFPSLTHNSTTGSARADNVVMAILDGVNRQGQFAPVYMPAFREALSDRQIADLTNYIAQEFGNPALNVTEAFVATQRSGGEAPLLLRMMPYVYGIVLVIVLGIVALWLKGRRGKKASNNDKNRVRP